MITSLAVLLTVFRIAVVPVQFQDCAFTCEESQLKAITDKAGTYLNDQFHGKYDFSFELLSPVTLPKPTAWYGENTTSMHDVNIIQALEDACRMKDTDVDFSEYDNDGDGKVDAVVLLTAGMSESDGAGDEKIWPQQGWLHDSNAVFSLDGVDIDGFMVVTELKSDLGANPRISGPGTLCHEFLHILGAKDLYDTDGEQSGGLGSPMWKSLFIMDEGNGNDDGNTPPNLGAVELEMLNIGIADTLDAGRFILEPIGRNGRYIRTRNGKRGDYYLFECREQSGWDSAIGGKGLLITHIDKTRPTWYDKWAANQINCNPGHPGAGIIAANPEAKDVSEVFFPQPGHNSFSSDTNPPFVYWDGRKSLLALTDIKLQSDGSISFTVLEPIKLGEIIAFQDAAMVNWTLTGVPAGSSCHLEWYCEGEEPQSADVRGSAYTIEHLKPRTGYTLTITVSSGSGETWSVTTNFKTKTYNNQIYPYIYLRESDRNEDRSFKSGTRIPLRIFNALDAGHIDWFYNGIPISTGADGCFPLTSDGQLKAIVYHADGTMDIIVKQIVVR